MMDESKDNNSGSISQHKNNPSIDSNHEVFDDNIIEKEGFK